MQRAADWASVALLRHALRRSIVRFNLRALSLAARCVRAFSSRCLFDS
jgi:hypothetical protein